MAEGESKSGISSKQLFTYFAAAGATAVAPFLLSATPETSRLLLVLVGAFAYLLVQGTSCISDLAGKCKVENKVDDKLIDTQGKSGQGITLQSLLLYFCGALATAVAPFLLSSQPEYSKVILVIVGAISYFLVQSLVVFPGSSSTKMEKLSQRKVDDERDDDMETKEEAEEEDTLGELPGARMPAALSWASMTEEYLPDDFEQELCPKKNIEPEPLRVSKPQVMRREPGPDPPRKPTGPPPSKKISRRPDTAGRDRGNRQPDRAQFNKERPCVKQSSAVPVLAPTFDCAGFDAQVDEMLRKIAPTPEVDSSVREIARVVKKLVQPILPDVEVAGFANGNISRGLAFGVAVPEVDIVVNATPASLLKHLPSRLLDSEARCSPHKLQKTAIRACTDVLTGSGGFKFRRSAFRVEDPKVTLVVPSSLPGVKGDGIAVDFSVNNATPLHGAALITECGHLDPRAKQLILLVRRWAKDRGIAHVSKFHLSPYAWTLLAIYFLQTAKGKDQLLPPLAGFPQCSQLAGMDHEQEKAAPSSDEATGKKWVAKATVAELFKEFITFYTDEFDWQKEAVCIRTGLRGPPCSKLPIEVVLGQDDVAQMCPAIEDPFDVKRNLGRTMTATSIQRLKMEFVRASWYSRHNASLSQLLEPWAPPEQFLEEADGKASNQQVEDDTSTAVASQLGQERDDDADSNFAGEACGSANFSWMESAGAAYQYGAVWNDGRAAQAEMWTFDQHEQRMPQATSSSSASDYFWSGDGVGMASSSSSSSMQFQ